MEKSETPEEKQNQPDRDVTDSVLFEAIAEIYNNWNHGEHERNKHFISKTFDNFAAQAIYPRVKSMLQIAKRLSDAKTKEDIARVFGILIPPIDDKKVKEWAEKFCKEFLSNREKSFLTEPSHFHAKKWFNSLVQAAEEKRKEEEQQKQKQKEIDSNTKKKKKKSKKKASQNVCLS